MDTKHDNGMQANRRSLLTAGLFAGGAAAVALGATTPAAAQDAAKESVLDKAIRTKKIVVAASLKYPPNLYINDKGEPDGYEIALIRRMMKDVSPDIQVEFADMDFGQMFAAVESGRADIMTTGTILPSRSLRGWFAGCAVTFQPVYVVGRDATDLTFDQMNSPDFKFAALQGSSQEAKIRALYPNANVSVFPDQTGAIGQVMSGRANATLQSLFTIVNTKKQGVALQIIGKEPAYVDHNTFFMPTGDMKMYMFVTNWLLFNAAGGILNSVFREYVGKDAIAAGLPYLAVGPGGSPLKVAA
ncbi:ABC transporter substrate-binding protein [Rhizobium sp. WYCCWR 11146]|uniref:substrate-binding periplasmic protein n=1 Tax=Rhizobium sp. WYCCWR 11146 TaxID=2749833 RepID=UPI0015E66AAA|nr:transporter substrate-binding domain-containing protein [Rhizobium sp. WYCCWR 11146]MBA1344901.1 transporter substrate-binding domain-containing protein [Rhizobium sp. WYCCWR 11146]